VEEIGREAGVLPCDLPRRGAAVRVRAGGEGEIPGVDALAGEIHRLPNGFHCLMRCRIRYFTDGAVIGSRSFVDEAFTSARERSGSKRKSGARKLNLKRKMTKVLPANFTTDFADFD
jgi:hypothetical protein